MDKPDRIEWKSSFIKTSRVNLPNKEKFKNS